MPWWTRDEDVHELAADAIGNGSARFGGSSDVMEGTLALSARSVTASKCEMQKTCTRNGFIFHNLLQFSPNILQRF